MRKYLFVFTFVFVLFGLVHVRAMSESKLLEKLTASYDINGYSFQLSESDKVLVKRYLDQYDVSSKDADYISNKVDEAISAMRKSGVKDFSSFKNLPSSLKSELKSLVSDVASNTSVKATVSKGNVVIYNSDGTVFAEMNYLVKNTGSNLSIVVASLSIIFSVCALVLVKKVNA